MALDGQIIRRTLLEICLEFERIGPGYFQTGGVLREAKKRLDVGSLADEQAILTSWGDLFRQGVLAWGYNLANAEPPHVHVTDTGRQALANLSRDPYNPGGYFAVVGPRLTSEPIAASYIEEAVRTFQAGCLKATAVMVGGAAEALVLSVRDTLVARLGVLGTAPPAKLTDWRVKTVRDAVFDFLETKKAQMARSLYERFDAYWVAVSDQMRLARNDAGHPASVDPVTHETVHAALLLFPELAGLVNDLRPWIDSTMT